MYVSVSLSLYFPISQSTDLCGTIYARMHNIVCIYKYIVYVYTYCFSNIGLSRQESKHVYKKVNEEIED